MLVKCSWAKDLLCNCKLLYFPLCMIPVEECCLKVFSICLLAWNVWGMRLPKRCKIWELQSSQSKWCGMLLRWKGQGWMSSPPSVLPFPCFLFLPLFILYVFWVRQFGFCFQFYWFLAISLTVWTYLPVP